MGSYRRDPFRTVVLISVAFGLSGPSYFAQESSGYDQPYRPQFHFSPQKNWTNDPNGPVYFEGEYHLFFQYNPFGDVWGHMSWGHAVSPDLVHWKELPIALPEEGGVMIFTGSTVVDRRNSSGFCKAARPAWWLFIPGTRRRQRPGKALQTQNLAFSNDRGRTWTKYRRQSRAESQHAGLSRSRRVSGLNRASDGLWRSRFRTITRSASMGRRT